MASYRCHHMCGHPRVTVLAVSTLVVQAKAQARMWVCVTRTHTCACVCMCVLRPPLVLRCVDVAFQELARTLGARCHQA